MRPYSPVQVTSLTPASCGSTLWRQGGVLWVTVIVKGTFRIQHDGVAEVASPLDVVREDSYSATGGSIAAAAETAPYVPNAGVVLSGHACAPAGKQVTAVAVRLGISGARRLVDKTLHVFGDRTSTMATAVRPFERMPLVYERALAGPDNPVGVDPGRVGGLPNVVDAVDLRRGAGFGPIASSWPARRCLLGGVDPKMLEDPGIEFPPGFSWAYFQSAPSDQQFAALQGDEWIVLDGMHPVLPRVLTRLPQATARAEWCAAGATGPGPTRSFDLSADTLIIDADRLLCSVVWRGRFAVDRPEAVPTLRVTAAVELSGQRDTLPVSMAMLAPAGPSPASPPPEAPGPDDSREETSASLAETQPLNLRALLPQLFASPTSSPLAGTQGVDLRHTRPALPFRLSDQSNPPAGSRPAQPTARPADSLSGTTDLDLRHLAVPPLPFPGGAGATSNAARVARIAEPTSSLAGTLGPGDAGSLRPALPFEPGDPSRPSAQSFAGPAAPRPAEDLSGTSDLDLRRLVAPLMPFAGEATRSPNPAAAPPPATAPGRERPGAALMASPRGGTGHVGAGALAQDQADTAAPDAPQPATSGELCALLLNRLRSGGSIDDLELAGADLSNLDLTGARLSGQNLKGSLLRGCKLVGASLVGTRLGGADLSGADLSQADLARADMKRAVVERARFDGAILRDAELSGARGAGASFLRALAQRASFARGVWEGVAFDDADAGSADFTGASLGGASFRRASLGDACFASAQGDAVFDDAKMPTVRAQGARLGGSSFKRIDAHDSRWEGAMLDEATFQGANLKGSSFFRATYLNASFAEADATGANLQRSTGDGASFDGASLASADLRQSRMVGASFQRARLHEAHAEKAEFAGSRFVGADLRAAGLRGCKLEQADFSQALLDGADLRDADLTRANVHGASRRATKMAGAKTAGLIEIDAGGPPVGTPKS